MSSKKNDEKSKRITVTIPSWLWGVIEKDFLGKMGVKDSEIVRNILIAYVAEYQKASVSKLG